MQPIDIIKYKGYEIEIYEDDCGPEHDPRGWDNFGTMICFHNKYNLGDKHNHKIPFDLFKELAWLTGLDEDDFKDSSEYQFDSLCENGQLYSKNLYLYDHSGLTISTKPFACPWDSGWVGLIYITGEKLAEMGLRDMADQEILDQLESEVKTYNNYLTHDIYRFSIPGFENFDTGGFLGDDHEESGLLSEARDDIDHILENKVIEKKNKNKYILFEELSDQACIEPITLNTIRALCNLIDKRLDGLEAKYNLKEIKNNTNIT